MQPFISFCVIFSKKCEDGHGWTHPDTKKPAEAGGEMGKGRKEGKPVLVKGKPCQNGLSEWIP